MVVGPPGITQPRAWLSKSVKIPGSHKAMSIEAWARFKWVKLVAFRVITMERCLGNLRARYWWTPPNHHRSQIKNAFYCSLLPKLMAVLASLHHWRVNNSIHHQANSRKILRMLSHRLREGCQPRKANLKSTLAGARAKFLHLIIKRHQTLISMRILRVMATMTLKWEE